MAPTRGFSRPGGNTKLEVVSPSVEAWVKPDPDTGGFVFAYEPQGFSTSGRGYYLSAGSNGVTFGKGDGDGLFDTVSGTADLADGQWHHVAGSFEPGPGNTGRLRAFVDGVEVEDVQEDGTGLGSIVYSNVGGQGPSPKTLYFGAVHNAIGTSYDSFAQMFGFYSGRIDRVRVHNFPFDGDDPRLDYYTHGCGDGVFESHEECDDGNTVDGDGCTADCLTESCGDGEISLGEECDDGNTLDGDCCSSGCLFDAPGASCSDGDACNGEETCDGAGLCEPGVAPDCEDDDVCTQDSCDASTGCVNDDSPAPTCTTGFGKGLLVLNEKSTDNEKLLVKFLNGPGLDQVDFGDPLQPGGTDYTLCIYDDDDTLVGALEVARAGDSCAGKDCWKPLGKLPPDGKGFLYKDGGAASDGVSLIKFKGGEAGTPLVLLKAGNNEKKSQGAMPAGIASALAGSLSATVQLHGSDAPQCYGLSLGDVKKSEATLFKAK